MNIVRENNEILRRKDQPNMEEIVLPPGAVEPVKNIVAGRILEIMLQDKMGKPNFDLESEAILDLIAKFPAICQKKYQVHSSDGNSIEAYPLLLLLHLKPGLDLVEKVFEAHPDALFQSFGYRPIDIACEMNASLEVVSFLHFQDPSAVRRPLQDGRYPLHVALSFYRKQSASVIDFLLNVFPEAATKRDSRGHYPLHHAAFSGAPVVILQRLHAICPESASATDDKSWTPLHYACRYLRNNEDNLAIISFLVNVAPTALTIQNQGGWTPVMTGVGHETPEVISFLLERTPNFEQDHGQSMLHLAAKHNAADSVEILAKRFPWMLISTGHHWGGTPLHYACKRDDNPIDIVKVLIRHDRRALITPDRQGKLPVNCAYYVKPDSDVTKLLMEETAKGAYI